MIQGNVMRNIFLLSMLVTIGIGTVSGTINMSIEQKNVHINDQFSLNIQIDPMGATVAGAQIDLRFNPAVIQVVNVTEGNFFNKGGPTFFMSDTKNISKGIIKNIAVAALHKGGENKSNSFVTINFKALSAGNSQLEIVNQLASDTIGKLMPLEIHNGSISVTQTQTVNTFNISGFVLNSNNNSGISNWSIILSNTTSTKTTSTTSNGKYQISGLYNGMYNITEVILPGWTSVGPTTYKVVINRADVNNQNFTNVPSVIPDSITGLKKVSNAANYINWTWADPKGNDFSKVIIYIDGKFKTNVSKGVQYYNATNLKRNTNYRIGTHTVDYYGNINNTWVINTAKTSK